MLRQIINCSRLKNAVLVKSISTASWPFIDVSVDQDKIAVLTMKKKPVNSLCPEMFQQMADAFDTFNKDKVKGVVFTSALPSIFSAGLDLKVIHESEPKRLTELIVAFRRVISELLTSNFITAIAINGHTSAGGCILAAVTEYRIFVDGDFTISLNDTELGIAPTDWIVAIMAHIMGARRAELAVTSSQLFYPREALEAGLVDDIALDREEAVDKCKQFIKRYDHVDPLARAMTKRKMRRSIIEIWKKDIETVSIEDRLKQYMDPELQKTIGVIVESIKNRKKK